MTTPGERLREARMKAGFTSALAAAEALEMKPSTYNAHERAGAHGARMYSPDDAVRYARRFGVTAEWLLFGSNAVGTLGGREAELRSQRTGPEIVPAGGDRVLIQPGGTVEAGTFRSVDEYGDDPPEPMIGLPDPQYPGLQMYYFNVAGDSMNALKPRPILSGDLVVGIDFEAFQGRVPLRDGMVVVVEQTTGGGMLRELSLKQLEIYEDRYEFHPRSSNSKHRPIVVPHSMEADDGRTVRVLAVARRIINELSL